MKPSRIAWIAGPALLAAWVILGIFFDTSPHLGWLPKWALGAAVLAPLAWIAVYTVQGLAGPGKWWQSDLGTNMVWLELAAIFTNGMIAWAAFFHHGELNTPAEAWCYIGGLLAGALVITWRSAIWLRTYRAEPPLLAQVRELETNLRETEAVNAVLRQRLGES